MFGLALHRPRVAFRWCPQWLCVATVILTVVTVAGCGARVPLIPTPTPVPTVGEAVALRVACPESVLGAVQGAAAAYQRQHPEVAITVLQRADAMVLPALRQGDADLAVLTWISEALPEDAWARPVARDGLAVVVNPQNGIAGLTMTQLQDLYGGRLENWETWGGLAGPPQLVSRETASGDYAFFQAWVMREARVSLNALMAPNSEAVLEFVTEDTLAVGYLSHALVTGSVRAVAINGVPPAGEAIAAGLYPLTRTHFLVALEEPEGALRGFAQWLLESPGQEHLSAHGLVPAPE